MIGASLGIVSIVSDLLQPATLVEVIVNGLAKAALYILIASGLTMIFGLMGVLNFAHGSMTMYGSYLGGLVLVFLIGSGAGTFTGIGLFFVAVVVTFGLLAAIGGVLEYGLVRKLYDRPPTAQILLMFGVLLIMEELARIVVLSRDLEPGTVWQEPLGTVPGSLTTVYDIGPVRVWGIALFEIVIGVITVVGILLFLNRTKYGMIIRAGSEEQEMTKALGIDVRRVFTVVFAIGTGLAGVAGLLLAWDPRFGPSVPIGVETLLIAFIVVVIGGLGTFRGTVYAGVLVGIVDAVMVWMFQNHVDFPALPQITLFALLVAVLVVRPQGLFGIAGGGQH